jgi:hypothetical protein
MIQHKIARILNGDPTYTDNWHDIAGYATLVEQHLLKARPASNDWMAPIDPVTTTKLRDALDEVRMRMPPTPFDLSAVAYGSTPQRSWVCTRGIADGPGKLVPIGDACPICYTLK